MKMTPNRVWRLVAFQMLSAIYESEEEALRLLRLHEVPMGLDDLPDNIPNSALVDITTLIETLWKNYLSVSEKVDIAFAKVQHVTDLKEFSVAIAGSEYSSILFEMRRDRPYEHLIWRRLKPVGASF